MTRPLIKLDVGNIDDSVTLKKFSPSIPFSAKINLNCLETPALHRSVGKTAAAMAHQLTR
jgi:hypothetical protein